MITTVNELSPSPGEFIIIFYGSGMVQLPVKTLQVVFAAVVIGSKIVQLLEEADPAKRVQSLQSFITEIREALDR